MNTPSRFKRSLMRNAPASSSLTPSPPPPPPFQGVAISQAGCNEAVIMVGDAPHELLELTDLFVPFHDQWYPERGKTRLLDIRRPGIFFAVWPNLSSKESQETIANLEPLLPYIKTLNLVVDLYGKEQSDAELSMLLLGQMMEKLANKQLTKLKIWIRCSIRMDHRQAPESDFDGATVKDFFGVLDLKENGTYLLQNLEHLWIDIREQFIDQQVDQGKKLIFKKRDWTSFPEQYLRGQKKLIQFDFSSTHRRINFRPEVFAKKKTSRFFLKIHNDKTLIERFSAPEWADWAPRIISITLAKPFGKINDLWPKFKNLSTLWAILDTGLTFVQLINSLGTYKSGLKLRVLRVDIPTKIFNDQQIEHFVNKRSLYPLSSIEVLCIKKRKFTHHDQIDLRSSLLSELFPSLLIFTLTVKGQCSDCVQNTHHCLYDYALVPLLQECEKLQGWGINLVTQYHNLLLDSTMPREVIDEKDWLNVDMNMHLSQLAELQPKQAKSTTVEVYQDGKPVSVPEWAVTLKVGHAPNELIDNSQLFAPWQDQWLPEEGAVCLLEQVDRLLPPKPNLTQEHLEAVLEGIKDPVHSATVPTALNLVIDLHGMSKEEVIMTMEQAKQLVQKVAVPLCVLRIWLRTSIRLTQAKKQKKALVDSIDLDLPVMKRFFDLFALSQGKGQRSLLENVHQLWIDLYEEFDCSYIQEDCLLPYATRLWKQDSLLAYLHTQTQLEEFAFNSNSRQFSGFPSKSPFSATKNLFTFKIFAHQIPAELIVNYGPKSGLERWAPKVTTLTLVPPYKLDELDAIWTRFKSLIRLRITLDKDCTFVQLMSSLAKAERASRTGWHLSVLEVCMEKAKIIDAQQFKKYFVKGTSSQIEVVSILKSNFTISQADQIDLQTKLFPRIFPNLRTFILKLIDSVSRQFIPLDIGKAVVEPVKACPQHESWRVDYWISNKRLTLDNEMDQQAVQYGCWFDTEMDDYLNWGEGG